MSVVTSQRAGFPCEIHISVSKKIQRQSKFHIIWDLLEDKKRQVIYSNNAHCNCLVLRGKDEAGRGGDDMTAAEDEEERKGPTAP